MVNRFEKRKLLYVEDDSISWLAAEASLEGKYSMFRARNAREAFGLLKDHSFDIVLMDVQLRNSELDGVVGIAPVRPGVGPGTGIGIPELPPRIDRPAPQPRR